MIKNTIFSLLVIAYGLLLIGCSSTPTQPAEWDSDSLDTARNVDFLSNDLKNLVFELNKMRTDPKKYATYERPYISRSLYRFLMNIEPVPPLVPAEGLSKLASNVFGTRAEINIHAHTALELAIGGSLISGNYGNSGTAYAGVYSGYQRRYLVNDEVVVRANIIQYLKQTKVYKSPENVLFFDCTYFGAAQSNYDRVANNITIIVVSRNYNPILEE